jgi:hypothetical protein
MQLSRRLKNLHPDKLLGTLQKHIDDGHEQAALQAIPELQLRHPGFHNELEHIRQRLSDKLLDDVKVLDRDRAVVFRCLNCGSGLARQSPETVHVICHYCGCDALHPASDIALERWNNSIDLEANFTIGDFFTFEGRRWQAVGVQLFSGRVREYDSEDGWESSYSRYTNWWMLNEQRELAWLIDDGRNRYWAEKYIPHDPELPEDRNRQFEHGSWTLEFAAGEFSYQPTQGERHNSAERTRTSVLKTVPVPVPEQSAVNGSTGSNEHHQEPATRHYYTSVESRLDADGEIREIEFFRSRKIPHEAILEGLNKNLELIDSQRWKRTMRTLLLALPLLAATFLYFNRGGDRVEQSVALSNSDKEVAMQLLPATTEGQVLNMRGSVSRLRNNSWFGVDVVLLNSDDEEVYSKYLEFWRESGVDSDGPWSEAKRSISWFVRIDEPDTYQVVIDGDEASTTLDTDFKLAIEPNRVARTPFLIGAFLTFFLVMLSRSKSSSIRASGASIGLRLNKGSMQVEAQVKAQAEAQASRSKPTNRAADAARKRGKQQHSGDTR